MTLNKKPVDRTLPTHELTARKHRKQVLPRLPSEPEKHLPPAPPALRKSTDPEVLEHLYRQFPAQGSLE